MDIQGFLTTAVVVGLIAYTIIRANQVRMRTADAGPPLNSLLSLILAGNLLLGAANVAVQIATTTGQVDLVSLVAYTCTTAGASALGWIFLRSQATRARFHRILPSDVRFDPTSPVHTTAVILALMLVSITVGGFVQSGGISGMADQMEQGEVSWFDVLLTQTLWLLGALLGIGIALRRTLSASFSRLGWRLPTFGDLTYGGSVGLLMVVMSLMFTAVWVSLVSPELFESQTEASAQLAQSFAGIRQGIILSLLVAFGEETFFRGALQPVFGNLLTSVFFLILHTQYTLTPASLLLFVVSLALGWLRNKHSTTAAFVAHFVYNGALLTLSSLQGGV